VGARSAEEAVMAIELTGAQLEALLADTRVKQVTIHLETADRHLIQADALAGRASLTFGRMPEDMEFLADPARIMFGQHYIALVLRPDLAAGETFRVRYTGTAPEG
jgi:hypothetical protein